MVGALLAAILLWQLVGMISSVIAAAIAVVVFWLLSPAKLDKLPRPLSEAEMSKLSAFLRENLGYIEKKEIKFGEGFDHNFQSKLMTAFGNADWWVVVTLSGPYRLKDHKGILIFGPYQKELKVAFESINIAVRLADADGDNVILCGF